MYRDFSFYHDGARYSDLSQEQKNARSAPYVQVWRIEGPALVIHFKGYPHVHAYMNVVRDPTKIAIGEVLTQTQHSLGLRQVSDLMTSMLKTQTKAPIAFYPDSLLGRISPGPISTGSIYTLDPYANKIIIAEIDARAMSAELRNSLEIQVGTLVAGKLYQVATIDYMLRRKDLFGVPSSVVSTDVIVRDQLIDFVSDQDIGGMFG